MAKGGYKAGGGRPRQANSRRSLIEKGRQAKAAAEAPEASDKASAPVQPENLDPLAYMLRVMNDPSAEPERRDRMAIAAAPFMHPRATDVAKGTKELQAERGRAAASGRFAPRPPPKLVA
jgi:hypothetical protein